jgi:hypothetical protein
MAYMSIVSQLLHMAGKADLKLFNEETGQDSLTAIYKNFIIVHQTF